MRVREATAENPEVIAIQLSITTDVRIEDPLEDSLRAIAAAGFTHLHWCHHWSDDFLYTDPELDQVQHWLNELHLQVHDLHGSEGVEKRWSSLREYERRAGVELVTNRIAMAQRFGCGVVIMHLYFPPPENPKSPRWDQQLRSLDELEPVCRKKGVRIAVENMAKDNFSAIGHLLEHYGPDYLGVCYDSGHGNICPGSLDWLCRVQSRLIATHLHDNDGQTDLHQPIFAGTVDWNRLAGIIAQSGYDRFPLTMEPVIKNSGIADMTLFLQQIRETGERFTRMVLDCRSAKSSDRAPG